MPTISVAMIVKNEAQDLGIGRARAMLGNSTRLDG